ncbi:hypothetical protein V8F06_010428 [Rhypophila decipiens]
MRLPFLFAISMLGSASGHWSRLHFQGDGGIRQKPKDSTNTRTMAGLRQRPNASAARAGLRDNSCLAHRPRSVPTIFKIETR